MNQPLSRIFLALIASAAVMPGAAQTTPPRQPRAAPLALVGGTLVDSRGGLSVRKQRRARPRRPDREGGDDHQPARAPRATSRYPQNGMTVLPGLWDPHVHLVYAGYPSLAAWFKK